MGFEEWFEKNGELYREPTSDERYLFEAGATSRQDEVDELKWLLKNANGQADDFCKESIELQKRIDEVNSILSNWDSQDSSVKYGGNYMLDQLLKIQELLK